MISMSRKQNGGFNKFLNFIGLVDEDRSQENRVDEYGADSYGRPSTYVPSRQRTADSRTSTASGRRSLPAQPARSSSASRRSYGADDESRYSSRRSARFEDDEFSQDYAAPRSTRSRSRFEESDEPVAESFSAPAPAQRPSQRATGRTVMFSLENLKDANMVITALVKGNTSVMTINTDDEHLKERIVDTLSGAVFALDATIRKASYQTYLLAPRSVNVKAAYEVDDQF